MVEECLKMEPGKGMSRDEAAQCTTLDKLGFGETEVSGHVGILKGKV
jgi:hypothetical protein